MAKQKPLVCKHLENISGDVLSRYRNVIRDFVKGQHGVYALYQKNRLQYVGLASNLRSRLGHHLKDRHAGTWDSFSVYLTVTDEHLRELESLVLRIAAPKGNKLAGQFFNSEDLRPRFRREISEFHKLELARMLGLTTPKQVEKVAARVKSNAPGSGMTIDLFIDFRWGRILNFEVRQNLRRPVFVLRQFHQRASRIVQVSDGPQP